MPSHPPPLFMEAVDKFEKLALSSPELTTEYLNLERLATLHKLKPKDYLRDVALKQFTLIKATFGRTRPVLEDLSKSPWKLDASAILDVFGPQSLISLEFLKRLRKFAKLDCPVSWDKAKAALDEASNRRLNNPGRGIPRCSWTPSDVTEAMKGLVDDEAERKKKDDTPAATAAQTASPAPSSADNVQDSDADTDDSHEDGLDDFGTNDSDSGSDVRTDSSDADDVEAARRDGLALPDLPTLDVDLDLTDSFVQQSPAHYTAVSCLSSPAPSAHLSEVERGPADRRKDTQSANVPLKRQRSRSFEPDANRSPLKYPRVFQDSEFTGAARRRSPGLPFQPMAPLVEESFSSPYMRPAALGQKEIDSQADHLGRALVDGHVSIRRPPRCSPTVNAMSPRQELQKTDASASRLTSLPGGSGRVNDDSDKGAAAVDTQWPPSNAAEVLQQLDSSQWLKHKTIWTIVELFLPPTQVRILDVAEPSAEQPWDLWASCNPLSRKESDSMLLFPLHLSKRKHWVLMCLDLDRCQASLFDSISDHATTQALGAAARAFVRALGLSWVDGSWTYHNNPRVLQQTNLHDCGIYVIISCIYLIARMDMPPDVDGSYWRIALSFAIDPQPKGFFTPPPVPAAPNRLDFIKDAVEAIQTQRSNCQILSKAAKHVEQMAHVLHGVYTRLRTAKSGLDEARQDVLVRQNAVHEWNRLPQLHASDVKIQQQMQETLEDARAQLQRVEGRDKRLHVSTTVLNQLYIWVEKQRVELRELRDSAVQAEAKAMAAVREARKLLDDLLQD